MMGLAACIHAEKRRGVEIQRQGSIEHQRKALIMAYELLDRQPYYEAATEARLDAARLEAEGLKAEVAHLKRALRKRKGRR